MMTIWVLGIDNNDPVSVTHDGNMKSGFVFAYSFSMLHDLFGKPNCCVFASVDIYVALVFFWQIISQDGPMRNRFWIYIITVRHSSLQYNESVMFQLHFKMKHTTSVYRSYKLIAAILHPYHILINTLWERQELLDTVISPVDWDSDMYWNDRFLLHRSISIFNACYFSICSVMAVISLNSVYLYIISINVFHVTK